MPALTDVEQRTREIVGRFFRKPPGDLRPETRLREDLGADSLDLVELLFEIEQELDVSIPEAEAADFRTIGDAVRHLQQAAP